MKVYDPQGNEYEKEPVDVRECVESLGWSTIPPEPAEKPAPKPKKEPAEKTV